ncbi:unnamed protein product [Rhizophagus irregularis]|nr:unnamed protein product [Rhizophagus irregularis]
MSNYPGQNILIEYLKERGSKSSYCGFLKFSSKFITASISPTDTCDSIDTIWRITDFDILVNEEHFRCIKFLQNFWQRIINEHKKENLVPFDKTSDIKSSEISQLNRIIRTYKKESLAPNVTSQLNKTSNIKSSEISQPEHTEKITLQVKQKGKLKRVRDDNIDTEGSSNAYVQVVDNALLVASAYESLIINNIIPFIKILKTSLLTRSRMSLSSANEPVLQAIVENLLPLKYCIPELSLVINGKKQKGSGRFGYSDIFILRFGANELEDLDKILEKENKESVLKRSYTYWSKEEKKTNLTTIDEILNKGLNQLNLYMKTISKGKAINYSSSGVFDERVEITKSKPNKLMGFVILVIGFLRILWRSTNEVTTNYIFNKI